MNIQVSLVARSETRSCSDISQIAGVAPDECREKGASLRPGQTPTREAVWKLQGPTIDMTSLEGSVDALIERLEPNLDKLAHLGSVVAMDLDCVVTLEDGESAPALGLSRRAVEVLARLRADIGICFY